VVDDEEVILAALARLLEREGYDVVTAMRPTVALETATEAEAGANPFDVVLSDYRMPEMVGSELLSKIAEVAPNAARLLITANTDFDTVSDAVNRGGVHRVVAKPWRPPELFSAVAEGARLARLQRENSNLQSAVQKQNSLLLRMNERLDRLVHERTSNLLDGLISALDYRDTETQWHSRRVSLYARRLAEAIDLVEPYLTVVEQGALLHDIGKIGVADSVLLKPGPLDDDEWTLMRKHTSIGFGLLQPIEFLADAAQVVLHHHEKFDGTGYHQQLSGEDIVIGARIFAVVDTYDAMTSDRPYRKALSPAIAFEEIERCKSSQFDPAIADAFTGQPAETWTDIRSKLESFAEEHKRDGSLALPPSLASTAGED